MNNHEFCADFAIKRGGRILDYGCGKGQIVELLLAKGADAYGCDVFYEGGSYRDVVDPKLIEGRRILEMKDRTPFPAEHFDVVVNNQVMEHVPDLDAVLREIHRVMKPGGVLLSLFPDKSVWREGHKEVPFLHRFPKGPLRTGYALAFRAVGLGVHHGSMGLIEWSRDAGEWIDKWCYYRSYREINETFSRHFSAPLHIEHEWLDKRKRLPIPVALKRFIVKKGAGLVFVCHKAA